MALSSSNRQENAFFKTSLGAHKPTGPHQNDTVHGSISSPPRMLAPPLPETGWCAKSKGFASPRSLDDAYPDGVTGNRTQNLLHSTDAVKHDAKKMSYH
jgi:hypothetical protein